MSLRLNPGLHTSGTIWHCDYVFHICIKVFFGRLWTNLFKMYFYSLTGLCRLVQQDFYSSESVKWFPPSLLLAYLTNISRFHTHFVSKSYQSIKGGEIGIIGATECICSKRQCNIIEYWWNIKPHINHAVNIRKGQSIFWFWFLWKQHWQKNAFFQYQKTIWIYTGNFDLQMQTKNKECENHDENGKSQQMAG